ncbi:MAG: heavy metal translocating P-type ATPase [Chloroflexota bacterium]
MDNSITTIKKYQLKNLDCANCAQRIEDGVNELIDVKFASVNFATATMHLDTQDLGAVEQLIGKIEPDVQVLSAEVDAGDQAESRSWEGIILVVSGMLFISGLAISYLLSETIPLLVSYLIFGLAYLIVGTQVMGRAVKNLSNGNWFDETFLMSISTIGAIAIGEYPEAVGVMLFYRVGEYIQQRSVNRSRRTIQALLDVRPDQANLVANGGVEVKSPREVVVGDLIQVNPGEKVPLDGIVIEGSSILDTSMLTGESVPVGVTTGDQVLAGTVNQTGMLRVEVTRPYEQTSISRMLELVQNAASRKARTEKFITRFAKVYSPIMVVLALLVMSIPPIFIPGQSFETWLYRALVLLVVSCPCALVISIPLGYFGGIGGASRRGILVKGANFLDVLSEVRTVVFDKTGTLTKGVFEVSEIAPAPGFSSEELLFFTAQAEAHSNHPVAESIRRAVGTEVDLPVLEEYSEIPGRGLRARAEGKDLLVGNHELLHEEGIVHEHCDVGGTVLHAAVDQEYLGYIVVSDEIKPEAAGMVAKLHQQGVERVVMLSGDQDDVARRVAEQLGLDQYRADLLPEDKVDALEEFLNGQQEGKLAFVGDGINDAPALARADVGIAMGAFGSDAAIETADVVLMADSLEKVNEAISLGKRTRTIVWQNIMLALVIKGVFIILGVLGVASMWEAVFGDVGVTILAVFNATRVLK